mmetsp:Transcript_61725/g.133739  ORF Transcript_61725/g.133739 Transcript_61725/m.133739 type:complete len:273 (+) Transcript_61725:391-1209(+)
MADQESQATVSSKFRARIVAASRSSSALNANSSSPSTSSSGPRKLPGRDTPDRWRPRRNSRSDKGASSAASSASSRPALARDAPMPAATRASTVANVRIRFAASFRRDLVSSRLLGTTCGWPLLIEGCTKACARALSADGRWVVEATSRLETKSRADSSTGAQASEGEKDQQPFCTFCRRSSGLLAWNGQLPLSSTKATAPTAQTSQHGSMRSMRGLAGLQACSGAQQWQKRSLLAKLLFVCLAAKPKSMSLSRKMAQDGPPAAAATAMFLG